MNSDDFSFEESGRPVPSAGAISASSANRGSCADACPLSRIPASVWKDVLHRPFRRRHPWIFWLGVVVFLTVSGGVFLSLDSDSSFMQGERMALVSITGPIMDAGPTVRWIRTLANDDDVRGVLVRVDSPGGGAAASQELYGALRRLAEKKPLAVSMGSMAASGGLMVSMAGQRIFANASTVTGSIGVRMDIPQVQGLLGKLGVGQETLTTAPYKDAGSYLRPLTPEQRAYFGSVLDDMHRQFVHIVAEGRHMEPSRVAALADGKIMTGREALALGLVDALGGEDEALQWLAAQCDVPVSRKLQTRPREEGWLPRGLKTLSNGLEDGLAALTGRELHPVFLFQL